MIHGPPGTGKSQTLTNIVGDHLARGERVLLVGDKRTALDIVKYRLDAVGLGDLCAVVHDPQRDQRDLYMGIRSQLDSLAETATDPSAPVELGRLDRELHEIHATLSEHDAALSERSAPTELSFAANRLSPTAATATAPLAASGLDGY